MIGKMYVIFKVPNLKGKKQDPIKPYLNFEPLPPLLKFFRYKLPCQKSIVLMDNNGLDGKH